MSKKIRAMFEVEIEVNDEEWAKVEAEYTTIWKTEIVGEEVPASPSAADALVIMVQQLEEGGDADWAMGFDIDWSGYTDEEFIDADG